MAPKTPIDDVPLIMVEKEEHIAPLLEDLLKCKTIAIDLEVHNLSECWIGGFQFWLVKHNVWFYFQHHSLRSFQGITCLIQISTGDKDYLVDTLSLRSDLHILNQALTDPKILKVGEKYFFSSISICLNSKSSPPFWISGFPRSWFWHSLASERFVSVHSQYVWHFPWSWCVKPPWKIISFSIKALL